MKAQKLPKQLFTLQQTKEILNLSTSGLIALDHILKPVRVNERRDRRYDSDVILDFIEKGGVK